MAKAAVATPVVDIDPIDRLEEKVKMLVGMIDRLRAEKAKASEDNERLTGELHTLRARLAEAESTAAELGALREERDLIHSRVTEMLDTIDSLNL